MGLPLLFPLAGVGEGDGQPYSRHILGTFIPTSVGKIKSIQPQAPDFLELFFACTVLIVLVIF